MEKVAPGMAIIRKEAVDEGIFSVKESNRVTTAGPVNFYIISDET